MESQLLTAKHLNPPDLRNRRNPINIYTIRDRPAGTDVLTALPPMTPRAFYS